jgi:hypothetical protein
MAKRSEAGRGALPRSRPGGGRSTTTLGAGAAGAGVAACEALVAGRPDVPGTASVGIEAPG